MRGSLRGYNAQIAVDASAQIIVATAMTQATNDKLELVPMARRIIENCGRLADTTSADAGYFSDEAVADPMLKSTDLLVPPDRQKHGASPQAIIASPGPDDSEAVKMRRKLTTPDGRDRYRRRKVIVEPVFGQIKEARGFRRFLLRGFIAAGLEFDLIALTHNLLKLFRSGALSNMGAAA
jgi:hypothetical protein